ncbi:unnamed protein product [Ascophyllum nodosum]
MSYQQHPGASDQTGRRQAPPYPLLGTNGAAGGRAPAAGVYGMPQYTQQQPEGSYGPPPSPVVGSWERGYVDDGYMRQDPSIISGATAPLASTTSGSGEGGFLVSGGANTMGAPLQSFYPPSMYGLPASMYPFQQPGAFPGAYPGSGGAGGGAAGSTGAAGSAAGGNFFGQGAYARSTNPGQPIQTTTNLQGPDGCNLFVFHIPNTMTNEALFRLFSKFGNVISARIMVEKATGRSRGFGFVSYDNRDSAEKAISQMNGYQIEHKRLKVQHKKDKERDRYVTTPSPRMMGPGPVAGRVQQQPPHYRQPLLPQHSAALRHPSVGDEKPPPPSPAADTGSSGVAPGFTVTSADEEDHGEASTTEVGMDGSVDPTYGSGSSRASAGDKYGRPNDHPHLAYIYRGRGTATREDESGGFSSGGGDGKAAVGEEKPQDQDPSGYGGRDDSGYLGAAPSASVGGRAGSPDPKAGVSRARSSSPNTATAALPHQSLEHAMQTKLTIGEDGLRPHFKEGV